MALFHENLRCGDISWRAQTIAIATVGHADPADPQNLASIEKSMRQQLPGEMFEGIHIFSSEKGSAFQDYKPGRVCGIVASSAGHGVPS